MYPWKGLVLALDAFYRKDLGALERAIALFPEGSFATSTLPLWAEFIEWLRLLKRDSLEADAQSRYVRSPLRAACFHSLFAAPEDLRGSADMVLEALDEGLDDSFVKEASRFLRVLNAHSESVAQACALCLMAHIDKRGRESELFLRVARAVKGEGEGLRLIALYLADSSPDLALLYWLKSGALVLSEGVKPPAEAPRAWLAVAASLAARAAQRPERERIPQYEEIVASLMENFYRASGLQAPPAAARGLPGLATWSLASASALSPASEPRNASPRVPSAKAVAESYPKPRGGAARKVAIHQPELGLFF
jgi:hypothetical protein